MLEVSDTIPTGWFTPTVSSFMWFNNMTIHQKQYHKQYRLSNGCQYYQSYTDYIWLHSITYIYIYIYIAIYYITYSYITQLPQLLQHLARWRPLAPCGRPLRGAVGQRGLAPRPRRPGDRRQLPGHALAAADAWRHGVRPVDGGLSDELSTWDGWADVRR